MPADQGHRKRRFQGRRRQSSQALALQSAAELKRAKRWSYVTLYAYRVKGDPFWKAVRPDGVPRMPS